MLAAALVALGFVGGIALDVPGDLSDAEIYLALQAGALFAIGACFAIAVLWPGKEWRIVTDPRKMLDGTWEGEGRDDVYVHSHLARYLADGAETNDKLLAARSVRYRLAVVLFALSLGTWLVFLVVAR